MYKTSSGLVYANEIIKQKLSRTLSLETEAIRLVPGGSEDENTGNRETTTERARRVTEQQLCRTTRRSEGPLNKTNANDYNCYIIYDE